jgi:transposase-like protein
LHLDEKYVKVDGKDCYDLNCIDSITKYVLAHLFVEKRTKKNCIEFLSQTKTTCYNQILTKYFIRKYGDKKTKLITFVCDGFENYKSAWKKLFYRVSKLQFGVPIACKKYNLEHNNNPIERYNGKIKDRLNAMRGKSKSFDRAKDFMNLQHAINNFVNPHQELEGKTPAEEAEIKLNLGRNKLLDLIRFVIDNHISIT